jgi:hypothetical protein
MYVSFKVQIVLARAEWKFEPLRRYSSLTCRVELQSDLTSLGSPIVKFAS